MTLKFYKTIILSIITLFFSIFFSLKIGQVNISYTEIWNIFISFENNNMFSDVLINLRLPRILFAGLAGAGLALCGYVMQTTVQNPLADPYVLGISSGASFGAAFSISFILPLGNIKEPKLMISIFAFIGAFLAISLVHVISNARGKSSTVGMILSGVIINALCIAGTNLFIYFARDVESARNITFWTMGSLSDISWDQVFILLVIFVLSSIYFLNESRSLNLMSLGDESATTLGLNVNQKRKIYVLMVTLLTGVIVAQCGIIGFVGLVVPHAVRVIFKTADSSILPVLILSGAIFMILVDVFSRSVIPYQEIPVGIITSLIGAPIFLFIFIRQKQ